MRPANVTIQSNLLEEFIVASDSASKSFAAAASECAEAAMQPPSGELTPPLLPPLSLFISQGFAVKHFIIAGRGNAHITDLLCANWRLIKRKI